MSDAWPSDGVSVESEWSGSVYDLPAPPVASQDFRDPEREAIFERERLALRRPSPASGKAVVLVGSFALFLLVGSAQGAPLEVVLILAAVLAVHEGGHLVAMQLSGYRDIRVFFIPFFGAAVAGRRSGVAAWKQGLALLSGPMPGLIVAFMLLELVRGGPLERPWTPLILTLLLVNGINMLPLGGLDGARLFQRVLFSRDRHLEIAFLATAGVTMLLLAVELRQWVLAIFATVGLAAIPRRHRVLELAHALRLEGRVHDIDLGEATEAELRSLFVAAYDALPYAQCQRERAIATFMEELADAARPPPSWSATVALLSIWLAGALIAAISALTLFR